MATAAQSRQVRDKIELDERPQTFALKQPGNGKEVGQYGSVMYSASDGRVLFVVAEDASDFHHQLVDMEIQPGEPISVARVKQGARGGGFAIRVRRVSDAAEAQESGPDRVLAAQLEKSIEMAKAAQAERNRRMSEPVSGVGAHANAPVPGHNPNTNNTRSNHSPAVAGHAEAETASISPASAKLCASLKAAIDAVVEAKFYASRLGLPLEFNEEDIRALAITDYIQAARS